MAANAKTTFELSPKAGSPVQFSLLDDLSAWLDKEMEFWEFTQDDAFDRHEFSRQLKSAVASSIGGIRNTVAPFKGDPSDGNRERLQAQLDQFSLGITSADAIAQAIRNFAEADVDLAGAVWFVATRPSNEVDGVRNRYFSILLRATTHAEMLKCGVHIGSVSAERAALETVRENWDSFNGIATRNLEEYRNARSQVSKTQEQECKAHEQKLDELFTNSKERLEQIEKTYREELKLRSSVDYWSQRASDCRSAAGLYTVAFLLTLGGTLGGLALLAKDWAIPEISQSVLTSTTASYWPIAILAGLAGMLMWPLRLLSRMIMSNMHLSADAGERATMVNTYLALTEEGKADQKDRQLVLTHLFRSSATGIVKEDGAPTGMAEMLSRLAGGK